MGRKGKHVKAYYNIYETQFQELYDGGVHLYDAFRCADCVLIVLRVNCRLMVDWL